MIKEDQGFFTNGPLTTPQNCRLRRDAISVIDCTNSFYFIGHIADGQVLAMWAGADLNDMEFVQFHPTDMVWPPSVKGTLTTEGEGDMLLNSEGKRFMFDNVPDMFKAEFSDTEDEANRWVNAIVFGKTPELLTRDVVAQAIRKEVHEGRRSPHGDVFLNIASRRSPENIKKKIPSMYHQSKELADVDITTNPIEVGPTCHYTMGSVRVDPES
ncbi:MAG: FAD-binding protein, partial [Pirellulaceae bacterium]|nr:FAD-binding protein [Pirellulaceae bacterium]